MQNVIVWLLMLMVGMVGTVQAGGDPGALELISTVSGQPKGNAFKPVVSADGSCVAFVSNVPLVPHDREWDYDVYLRDLKTGALERVSEAFRFDMYADSSGVALSADARFVVYEAKSDLSSNGTILAVKDRLQGTTDLVEATCEGAPVLNARNPSISDDGRYLAFQVGSGNGYIFLYDRQLKLAKRIAANASKPLISGNGRFVVYRTSGSVELWDQEFDHTELLAAARIGPTTPAISRDGRFIVYEVWTDNYYTPELFLFDRNTRAGRKISRITRPLLNGFSWSMNQQLSADGRYLIFLASATDLLPAVTGNGIYLHDLAMNSTVPLPLGKPWSNYYFPWFSISGDASLVAFQDRIADYFPKYSEEGMGVFVMRTGVASGSVPTPGGDAGVTAEPAVLWPPNSKFTEVKLTFAADPAAQVEFRIADEYGTLSQTVTGNGSSVRLEAWRDEKDKDGRSYTVTAVATMADGRQQTATTVVTVPHDQR